MNTLKSIALYSPAKINLSLDIKERNADGYHSLESVFQAVSIYDRISIEQNSDGKITVSCSESGIPINEGNICWKAAERMLRTAGITSQGLNIYIDKHIPSQAGLGGGSSDAAAVMVGLNNLFELGISSQKLYEIGSSIGADVPFFINGGTASVSGIGEHIEPLSPLKNVYFVIAKPDIGISTAEAYRKLDSIENIAHTDTKHLCREIENGNVSAVSSLCINNMEAAADYPEINVIKKICYESGALLSLMSGSGSAVFGMFTDIKKAKLCSVRLKSQNIFSEVCAPVDCGVTVSDKI